MEHETLSPLVAIGIIHHAWRNTELEDWHSSSDPKSPTDYDMFRANIILTRAVLPSVLARPMDVTSLRRTFTNPRRRALPNRSAKLFCGPVWHHMQARGEVFTENMESRIAEFGEDSIRLHYAGGAIGSDWWGTPDFRDRVRSRVFAKHRPDITANVAARLAAHSETMSKQEFRDVVYCRLD